MAVLGTDNLLIDRAGVAYKALVSALATFLNASPQITGVAYTQQGAPTAKSVLATLTIAELLTRLIQTSGTTYTLTLPTGTLADAGILGGALALDRGFDWSISSTASGIITIAAGVGHTIVGTATIPAAGQATFRTRKTATNTFVTYRIA